MSTPHWVTFFDPESGEAFGEACRCELGDDHTAAEYRAFLDERERELAEEDEMGHGGPV